MRYSHNDFEKNKVFSLGTTSLEEQEIIDFAKAFDPLDFHIDKSVAEKSIFGGIIASGPHVFNKIHRTQWIPLFGHTVICGLEINNWKFLKPVYPKQNIHARATIKNVNQVIEKKYVVVKWTYEFEDDDGELVQSLDMTVSHKMN